MATVVFMSGLICLFFTASIRWLFQGQKIKQLEWDMATVTAGDYSVELDISKDMYQHWYHTEFSKAGGDLSLRVAPALSLKKYIQKEVEEAITQDLLHKRMSGAAQAEGLAVLLGRKKRNQQAQLASIKIADIVFSFKNAALI